MREAIINYLIAMILLVIFLTTIGDIEQEISIDLFVFMLLTLGFIMFANYQRNRLDHNRRELALEKERSAFVKQMIDNISHDFKTPLSVIHTSLYLTRRLDTLEKREQHLQVIENQALRLGSMVQNLITLSKLDHKMTQEFTNVDLKELVNSVQKQLSSIATTKRISINRHTESDICDIHGNFDDLERMIVNVMENAINYTLEGGIVTIKLSSSHNGYLHLEVADTGVGMSKDDAQRIFERFFRADTARSTHTGGSGLGLTIVKQIVDRHAGKISVESELGVGTVFSIILPIS